jgi:DNA polymerase III delta prime subunit
LALRWIEEGIWPKNKMIDKQPIEKTELPEFTLSGAEDIIETCIDFLEIDQGAKLARWWEEMRKPPLHRVLEGNALILSNITISKSNSESDNMEMSAKIEIPPEIKDISLDLSGLSTFQEDDYVRVCVYKEEKNIGEFTGKIVQIDWDKKDIRISFYKYYLRESCDKYKSRRRPFDKQKSQEQSPNKHKSRGQSFPFVLDSCLKKEESYTSCYATLDKSPSDFVGRRVHERLQELRGSSGNDLKGILVKPPEVCNPPCVWIDKCREYAEFLKKKKALNESQAKALDNLLSSRIFLLQGPPGTGKTQTTAVAILMYALSVLDEKGGCIAVASHTNTAIETLYCRVVEMFSKLSEAKQDKEWRESLDKIRLCYIKYCLYGKEIKECLNEEEIKDKQTGDEKCSQECRGCRCGNDQNVKLILFGTTNDILKLFQEETEKINKEIRKKEQCILYNKEFLKPFDVLVIDEASMMVFPHFVALASLIDYEKDCRIMLAGDHRQLAPIVHREWEEEDRPGVQRYLPYMSVFEWFLQRKEEAKLRDTQVKVERLSFSHRLPLVLRRLIQPLYDRDNILLTGKSKNSEKDASKSTSKSIHSIYSYIANTPDALYLLVHDEQESTKSNPLEAEIVKEIVEKLLKDSQDSSRKSITPKDIAVVTPFRRHRALLKETLKDFVGEGLVVDTVERLQGGERKAIIYSAAVSSPSALMDLQEFILDVTRTNVAFSRAKEKLIVVVSQSVLDYVPVEEEQYEDAVLWKSLRRICSRKLLTCEYAVLGDDEKSTSPGLITKRPSVCKVTLFAGDPDKINEEKAAKADSQEAEPQGAETSSQAAS